MAETCKDCGDVADPECTIVAAEFDMPGEQDLYHCRPCYDRSMALWKLIEDGVRDGKCTMEDVEREIRKAGQDPWTFDAADREITPRCCGASPTGMECGFESRHPGYTKEIGMLMRDRLRDLPDERRGKLSQRFLRLRHLVMKWESAQRKKGGMWPALNKGTAGAARAVRLWDRWHPEDVIRSEWKHECESSIYYVDRNPEPELLIESAYRLLAVARHLAGVSCRKCGGVGHRGYSSTATWMGGIGGQMITEGVCDSCWGTGRSDKTGVNLRRMMGK